MIVGSGPNGLAAAIALAQGGAKVLVLEAMDEIGGGVRSAELTLPGFKHDVCSGAHPMGILSPFFSTLPLARHGLEWIRPGASVAHPLDGEPAVILWRSLDETARELGLDEQRYRRLLAPFLQDPRGLIADALDPLGVPRHPFLMLRFGLHALRAATRLARSRFRGARAQALFAGCAAHSILPLEQRLSAAVGLLFLITAHVEECFDGWHIRCPLPHHKVVPSVVERDKVQSECLRR